MKNFRMGDRVEDRESHETGTIVHVYRDPALRDEIIVVRFGSSSDALAVPTDTVKKIRG